MIGLAAIVLLSGVSHAGPVQLTGGPGNDTEAAWSPDGRQIAFQSDRNGTLDLYLMDVATKAIRPLVEGPGHSAFPAWSPDGRWVVYSHAEFVATAFEGQEDGYNLFLVPAKGGRARRLTGGHSRDYCPAFTADGKQIWFSSDREGKAKSNAVSLWSIGLEGGEPRCVVSREGTDRATVGVSFAGDGRHVAYGWLAGFRDNWSVRLARVDCPAEGFPLFDARACFYAPRFCPTAALLACTGFSLGEAGWGVYVIDARNANRSRLDTGPGNARSPAWSPDGKRIVFENNQSGTYKLYCLDAPAGPIPTETKAARSTAEEVLNVSFAQRPGPTVTDMSPRGNTGQVHGAPEWRDGAAIFRPSGSFVTVPKAKGLDFGAGPFAVRAVVRVPADCKFAMIAMGEYPGNRLGWQLYVGDDRRALFNSRTPDLLYRGARSDDPLPVGRSVTLVGTRDAAGRVRLYVDGAAQQAMAQEAGCVYGPPVQVRIGTQYNGTAAFPGGIAEVTVWRGELSTVEVRGDALRRFWAEER